MQIESDFTGAGCALGLEMGFTSDKWTDEKVEQLKTLWAQGLSASQVAAKLGREFTRSAVIGKKTRLNLPDRPLGQWATRRIRKSRPQKPRIVIPTTPVPDPIGPLDDFPPQNTCRFPTGEGCFPMCGHPVVLGTSWCIWHRAVCFTPIKQMTAAQRKALEASQLKSMKRVGLG